MYIPEHNSVTQNMEILLMEAEPTRVVKTRMDRVESELHADMSSQD
jgi:hypothetical protein